MEKLVLAQAALISEDFARILSTNVIAMQNWKWLVLVAGLAVGFLLYPIFQFGVREIKKRNPFTRRKPNGFAAHFFSLPIEKPLAWGIILLLWMALGDAVGLAGKVETYYQHILRAFLAFHVLKLIYFAIDAMTSVFLNIASKTESTFDDQLIPFASKSLKALLVVLGVLMILQSFGLNVMSLLAGLGLGGLALALAAQDTAANLFGSITILFDSPFKVGDLIKVKDIEGTVEEIGFRSTRVRTFYNSLVTLPNSVVAKENIDNLGLRPARRSRQILGLTYETPPETIKVFCTEVQKLISNHPKVNPSTVMVYFNNFNSFSLDVLTQYHLQVYTAPEELEAQMEIFLQIMDIAKKLHVDFAYPTQTIYQMNNSTPLIKGDQPLESN